ncbi:hypothetical protein DPMN_189581 [Dreissena polymorpha]|uniref:Uncharacterized protein n=1 Tax=Dreissena polymorpha TaxID=45954 RepID=A0A9D4I9M2_DREPO|nr:hypothetical protein DPMN_189581 [Dreissena polymorpha]
MATGQNGPRGLVVRLRVTWVYERGPEPALILNQTDLGTIASGIPSRIQFVFKNHAPTEMEAGRAGLRGKAVQSRVEWVRS